MREYCSSGYLLPITLEVLGRLEFNVPEEYEEGSLKDMLFDMFEEDPHDGALIQHIRDRFGMSPSLMFVGENFTIDGIETNTWVLLFSDADKYQDVEPCQNWRDLVQFSDILCIAWSEFG